jgi:intein/homing endonuclease
LAVVDQLNGVISSSSINISEQNPERKLLTIKDMLARENEIKNNSILFYLYDDGTIERRIIVK